MSMEIEVTSKSDDGVAELKDQANTDDPLLSGLSRTEIKKNRVAAAFWKYVWPKLEESGWVKVCKPHMSDSPKNTVFATKKDIDWTTSRNGEEYYTSIKDVLERIDERRTTDEAIAADIYRSAISKPVEFSVSDVEPTLPQKRPKEAEEESNKPQEPILPRDNPSKAEGSKRETGEIFPKKSSRIGEEYQATSMPPSNSSQTSDSDQFCELVWDPKVAQEMGIILEEGKDVVSSVAHNLKEEALLALSAVNYNVEYFQSKAVKNLKPMDGSDWTRLQRESFHLEIFRTRRCIPTVAKLMGQPVKVCHAYYLEVYKNSNEYRLLKTVCMEEREHKEEEVGFDSCAVCGEGGNLLICDGCESEYHMTCLRPALLKVPEGQWECDNCVDRNLLNARSKLIQKSGLFEKIETQDNRVGATTLSNRMSYRPVAPAVEAVQRMARAISQALNSDVT